MWLRRVLWLIGLYMAGVLVLAAAGLVMHGLMDFAGLTG